MKISILRYLLATLFTVFMATARAEASSADLSTLLNAVHSMKASFTQTVYDNHGKAIQQSFGRMAMQRPGKFRWEVLKPIPQTIIANQTKLWIYDPDLEQVTIRSLAKAAGETPALLLSSVNTALDKDFNVSEVQKNTPNWRWFQLVPKKSDDMFSSVQMGFVNAQIHEMDLKDQLGHTTKIVYKNIETNISLASSLFTFNPPANVDVIDETRKK